MGRVVPANGQTVTALVFGPDAWSQQLAGSMAIANNTWSPMAAGIHSPGASARGFTMDRGSGVNGNRWAGRTPYPVQQFAGAAVLTVARPASRRLGAGAGASGQPGLPSTGADNEGLAALAWMGYGQLGRAGMGS